jgi:hypothetical protein
MDGLDLEQRGQKLAGDLMDAVDGLFTVGVHLHTLACSVRAAIGDPERLKAALAKFEPHVKRMHALMVTLQKLHLFADILQYNGEEKDAT